MASKNPIEQQVAKLDALLGSINQKQMPRAVVSALNKTAPLARTRTIKGTAKQTKIQQKLIRQRVFVRRATTRTMTASIRAYTRGVGVIHMKPRDTGKGGWKNRRGSGVKAAGGRQYRNAFVAKTPGGKKQVFERTGRVTGNAARRNYHHITVVREPIRQAVENIAPRVAKRVMQSRFHGLLAHEIDRRIKGIGKQ